MNEDFTWAAEAMINRVGEAAREFMDVAWSMNRPFMLLKPKMTPDGNQWCALYGDNLQDGVAGFGDTPEQAAVAFDLAWLNAKAGVRPIAEKEGVRHDR